MNSIPQDLSRYNVFCHSFILQSFFLDTNNIFKTCITIALKLNRGNIRDSYCRSISLLQSVLDVSLSFRLQRCVRYIKWFLYLKDTVNSSNILK